MFKADDYISPSGDKSLVFLLLVVLNQDIYSHYRNSLVKDTVLNESSFLHVFIALDFLFCFAVWPRMAAESQFPEN